MKFFFTALLLCIISFSLFISCEKQKINKKPEVIAGQSVTIKLPLDSVLLQGTANDDVRVIGVLWSKVSGPGEPVIANPGSSTTMINSLTEGTYLFQLMATDNEGAMGVDTISILVAPADAITVSLNPDHNETEVHIWGNNAGRDETHPGAVEIGGVAWTSLGDPIAMRAALKFDLSNIPSTAKILSAKLTLYSNPTPLNGVHDRANSGTDNTVLIQQITTDWVFSTVNWVNQPSATAVDQIVVPHTNEAFLDLTDLDVSKLIENMVSAENYGFLIRLKTESIYTSRIFCSSKYPDATKHPKLEVIYSNQ
jgi:hypothetical protein